MTRIFTLLFLIFAAFNTINAQQQLLNPGFEEWENVWVGTDEPVHWSSIKTSDSAYFNNLAPVVWGPSTDAHTGNYSLRLFNYDSFVIATGMMTNGRAHTELPADLSYVFTDQEDDKWHRVLTERPDSVAGWFKCNPGAGDFGTVKFILHTGYAQLPGDELNSIAMAYYELPTQEITQWTRFSVPFVYYSSNNPEYILSVLTSGNGIEAMIGSTALFDDIELIYNESSVIELSKNQFKIFSNDKRLNILIEENKGVLFEIRLLNTSGRTVLTDEIVAGENNTINISSLPTGLYIVVASNSTKMFSKKILLK